MLAIMQGMIRDERIERTRQLQEACGELAANMMDMSTMIQQNMDEKLLEMRRHQQYLTEKILEKLNTTSTTIHSQTQTINEAIPIPPAQEEVKSMNQMPMPTIAIMIPQSKGEKVLSNNNNNDTTGILRVKEEKDVPLQSPIMLPKTSVDLK